MQPSANCQFYLTIVNVHNQFDQISLFTDEIVDWDREWTVAFRPVATMPDDARRILARRGNDAAGQNNLGRVRNVMRAAVCHEFGKPYRLEDVDLRLPDRDEVTVRLKATSICHSDIMSTDGGWGGDLPAIYGHEGAGVVERVGVSVDNLAPGDHVIVTMVRSCGTCPCCTRGLSGSCEDLFDRMHPSPITGLNHQTIGQGLKTAAFAERALVHQSQLVTIEPDIPFEIAALLACGVITGFGAVANTARMRANSDVVVIGAGGVGLNSVQAAAILGATRIIAIDLGVDKLDTALAFGATHAIDASKDDPAKTVFEITQGRGADYVFVTVGAKSAIDMSYQLLAPGGMAVLVGMPKSGVTSIFDPVALANASQQIVGSKLGAVDIKTDIPKLIELYRQSRLKLDELITGRFAFDDINQAIATARAGTGIKNVVLFD